MEGGRAGAFVWVGIAGSVVGGSGCGCLVGRLLLRARRFLRNVIFEKAIAIGLLVEVAHELTPAEELADEAFAGSQGGGARDSAVGYVADEVEGEEATQVEEDRSFRVKELKVVVTHGVFKGSEVLKAVV